MKYIYTLLVSLIGIPLFYGCLDDPELPGILNGGAPTIQIDTVMNVKANSLRIVARITKQNGSAVSGQGFSWAYAAGDTQSIQVAGKKDGDMIKLDTVIYNLVKDTVYTFTAFARNAIDEAVSSPVTVRTSDGLGRVQTLKPDSIRGISVMAGGLILDPGEGGIKTRGVYLSKDSTLAKIDSAYKTSVTADSFVIKLGGLTPSTTYYVLAYVESESFGIFKGTNIEKFRTTDGKPVIDTLMITGTSFMDASFSVTIGDEGDSPVTKRGVCWSATNQSPDISNDTLVVDSKASLFTGSISGLVTNTKYYVRAYATNSYGTTYSSTAEITTVNNMPEVETTSYSSLEDGSALIRGNIVRIGMGDIRAYGFCYGTVPEPTITNMFTQLPVEGQLEGPYSGTITKLKGGKVTYYVRAYLINTSGLIAYGDPIQITTPDMFDQMTPFTETGRMPNSSVAFTIGANGYLLGGDLGSQYTNELVAYNAADNRWDKMASMPVSAGLKWQAAAVVNNAAYVLGGINNAGSRTNGLYRYYPNYNTWETVSAASGPDALSSAAGCSLGSAAYYIGGLRDTISNEVWSFDTSASVWTKKSSFPVKQHGGIAVNIGGTIYAGLGLSNTSGTTSNNRLWMSADMNTWTELASFGGGIARGAVVFNGSIYVVDATGTLWRYAVDENRWIKKSQLDSGFQNDVLHCMYTYGKYIYVGLGNTGKTLYRYNPAWEPE